MKLRLSFGSKTDKLVIPSPVKDKPLVNVDRPIAADGALKSQWSTSHPAIIARDFVSKEETFFDSQPWLESDCDDDFFSVCGDFTPSRGNTPVHQSFSAGTPRANRANFSDKTDSKPELSPKKRLFELFRESLGGNQDFDNLIVSDYQNGVNGKIEAKTTTILGLPPSPPDTITPFASGANSMCSSERTPNGDYRPVKEKQIKAVQCCLPRMLSCRGYGERKKMSSPSLNTGN